MMYSLYYWGYYDKVALTHAESVYNYWTRVVMVIPHYQKLGNDQVGHGTVGNQQKLQGQRGAQTGCNWEIRELGQVVDSVQKRRICQDRSASRGQGCQCPQRHTVVSRFAYEAYWPPGTIDSVSGISIITCNDCASRYPNRKGTYDACLHHNAPRGRYSIPVQHAACTG